MLSAATAGAAAAGACSRGPPPGLLLAPARWCLLIAAHLRGSLSCEEAMGLSWQWFGPLPATEQTYLIPFSCRNRYLEQILNTGIGVPRHPLFFLGKKYRGTSPGAAGAAAPAAGQKSADDAVEVGQGVLGWLCGKGEPERSGGAWGWHGARFLFQCPCRCALSALRSPLASALLPCPASHCLPTACPPAVLCPRALAKPPLCWPFPHLPSPKPTGGSGSSRCQGGATPSGAPAGSRERVPLCQAGGQRQPLGARRCGARRQPGAQHPDKGSVQGVPSGGGQQVGWRAVGAGRCKRGPWEGRPACVSPALAAPAGVLLGAAWLWKKEYGLEVPPTGRGPGALMLTPCHPTLWPHLVALLQREGCCAGAQPGHRARGVLWPAGTQRRRWVGGWVGGRVGGWVGTASALLVESTTVLGLLESL